MTTIGMGTGGRGSLGGGPGAEDWMRPQYGARQSVNWNDKQYATPGKSPRQKYGRYIAPVVEVPTLPERNIRVKSKAPAMYYTLEGNPIPADQFVTVPISCGIMAAIKAGDLERGPDPEEHQVGQQPSEEKGRPRHHRVEVKPAE